MSKKNSRNAFLLVIFNTDIGVWIFYYFRLPSLPPLNVEYNRYWRGFLSLTHYLSLSFESGLAFVVEPKPSVGSRLDTGTLRDSNAVVTFSTRRGRSAADVLVDAEPGQSPSPRPIYVYMYICTPTTESLCMYSKCIDTHTRRQQ